MQQRSNVAGFETALHRTRRFQLEASDPRASAWVSANAGTGKTHVLTMRVLRLLLQGTPVERILCLTYTKAAAAEMAKRVHGELARWIGDDASGLANRLNVVCGRQPAKEELARARTLFAEVVEAPGGLRVETIHAFAERLLKRFPLEGGVPASFATLDEDEAHSLQREAIDAVLGDAMAGVSEPLGRAVNRLVRYAADAGFDAVLRAALDEREWLDWMSRLGMGELGGPERAADVLYRRALSIREGVSLPDIERELLSCLAASDLPALREHLSSGSTNDVKAAERVAAILAAGSSKSRIAAFERLFCTEKGESRKSLMTAALKHARADLDARLCRAQETFCALAEERRALEVVEATLALLMVAGAVAQRYADLKSRRAALDFDDLVAKAASLLQPSAPDGGASAAEWVLYKFDGGLDHVLVDESQDTSPAQWRIVEALSRHFFAGTGAREELRTLFAVGDEKQSIFSFQGAAPEMFAGQGTLLAARAEAAGHPWRRIPLNVSFRSTAPILDAVDHVFADPARTPGLTAGGDAIEHVARRSNAAGLIEIWPTETHEQAEAADAWSPLDEGTTTAPAIRLARKIAATIRGWLDQGERLESENRPVRAGDILILVRKRNPFAGPMVAALEAAGIPVAGADRITLARQIAVMDLLALIEVITLPGDDLSLATVLKSPLFDFDDNDLMALACGRTGTLWASLAEHAGANQRFALAAGRLADWSARAEVMPPFEFLASILDGDGMRARVLERLGAEAADSLDEFLGLALSWDDRAPPSLTGFLQGMKRAQGTIRRDMEQGRDEVRVMTVHGAKGLEAPIVFLPDCCTTSGAGRNGGLLRLSGSGRPIGMPEPFVWTVKGASGLAALDPARAAKRDRETHERNRLLYVAMTRARDRLYVTGFEGKKARDAGCWYDLVTEALTPSIERAGTAGGPVWRRVSPQHGPAEGVKASPPSQARSAAPPAWAARAVDRPVPATVLTSPSRLAAQGGAPDPQRARGSIARALGQSRGVLTHMLLQHLPFLPRAKRADAAGRFLAAEGEPVGGNIQKAIIRETMAILDDPALAPLFGPDSRAEVPLAAIVRRPGGLLPLEIKGTIDRLAILGGEVRIVDYKTSRPVPADASATPESYLLQLAAYRLALAAIFPAYTVRAAILWTEGPRLVDVPAVLLDRFESQLLAGEPLP